MITKIKTLILSASLVFALAAPLAITVPASVSAAPSTVCTNGTWANGEDKGKSCADIKGGLCQGTNLQVGSPDNTACKTAGEGESRLNSLITQIINIISVIVAIVAVIMLIFGGFRYVTSGGASDKVKGAKDTILYALIGLVIVALAQTVVKFVVNKLTA